MGLLYRPESCLAMRLLYCIIYLSIKHKAGAFMRKEEQLKEFILRASLKEILELTEELHPVDLLEVLQEYEALQKELLEKFPDEYIAMVIDEAELDEKFILLSLFPADQKQEIISEMSSDELADMLGIIDEDTQNRILEGMEEEHREEIEELL